MFLESDCRGVYFILKCQIRKYYYFWQVLTHLCPNILGPNLKLIIWLPIFSSPRSEVSKEVCHTPVGQKLRGEDRFSRNRPFLSQGHTLEAGWSDTPAQKLLVWSWRGPEKFIKILTFNQKLFNFLIQTNRQTDAHPPIHIQMCEIFYALFWYLSLHYIHKG